MIYIVAEGLSIQEMGWAPMRHNNYAVTEIISFILVIFIISGATTVVLLWAGPAMEQAKTSINLESTFFQLKALSDLVDRVSNQGVGSSQEMSVETENGNFYFDDLSERIVIYYSLYEYDPALAERPFDFTVERFEIGNPDPYSNTFRIDILSNPSPGGKLKFELYKANKFVESAGPYEDTGSPDITFTATITDKINTKACIRILEYNLMAPPGTPTKEYGEIWVFDLGSLNYEVESAQMSKAVVENGGVAKVTSGGYLADEPRYWDKNLLSGSNMTALRIINIQPEGSNSLGGAGKFKTKFNITAEEVQVLEARTKVFGNIKMKIYGDDSVVSAWYNFYEDEMNFVEFNGELSMPILGQGDIKPNYMFSLVYAKCNLGMEMIS